MKLIELSPAEYAEAFPAPLTPYGSVDFNMLNASKVDSLIFVAMIDTKQVYRLGMILGRRDTGIFCPFSAPFGELSYNKPQKLETVCEFFDLLIKRYGNDYTLTVTLPPSFYMPDMQPKTLGALKKLRLRSYHDDYNYHYLLSNFREFQSQLDGNARNHLNRALRENFIFVKASLADAYAVISQNREERGYPLRMTLQQLIDTSKLITIDSFTLNLENRPVAAAIVYRLNQKIAQVIYWGHLGQYSELRPMNLLAREVFGHYHSLDYEIVDLGPSSSNGILDLGLATFKESLGSHLSFKPTITK